MGDAILDGLAKESKDLMKGKQYRNWGKDFQSEGSVSAMAMGQEKG